MNLYYNEDKTEAVLNIGDEYLKISEFKKEIGKDFEFFCNCFRDWYYSISDYKRYSYSIKELFRDYITERTLQ